MKNKALLQQTMGTILFVMLALIMIIPGCKTGELKDRVSDLSQQQNKMVVERDSLMQLVVQKSMALDVRNTDYNTVTAEKEALAAKNKSLQSGLNAKAAQLKKSELSNTELNNTVAQTGEKNDSLLKEISALQQKISAIDAAMAGEQKNNALLAQTLREKEEKRIADSIAEANKPVPVVKKLTGYINITEVGAGVGLGDTDPDYSRSMVTLNNINGYVINERFMTGIGLGVNFYNGGTMIPLYLDVRYTFKDTRFSPFIVADGGLLFSLESFSSSGLYINPAFGISRKLNNRGSFHLSTGLWIQHAPTGMRNSFINFKGGVSFRGR